METEHGGLTISDTIDKLLWPPDGNTAATRAQGQSARIYNALRRNGIEVIGDLLAKSRTEVSFMRMMGERSLAELDGYLEAHGWALAEHKPASEGPWTPDERATFRRAIAERMPRRAHGAPPEGLEEAAWIGRQLEALSESDRVYVRNRLGGRYDAASRVENRRRAWAWYRWGTTPDAGWPKDGPGGYGFMANPLPGSVDLHLEGLNRLAHEELDR